MRLDALAGIALAVAQERTAEAVLAQVVRGLAQDPAVALARIWLVGPGDLCGECRMAPECHDRSRCLHLGAGAGTPRDPAEDWTRTGGAFRRLPLNAAVKITRIATSGTAALVDDVGEAMASSDLMRPERARAEGITGFAGQPLVYQGQVLGMLGVFLRGALPPASFAALRTFADHAAVAIANARAFDEVVALEAQLQAERDRLRVLLDVTNAVSRERTLDGLFVAIGQALRWVVDHDGSNLCLFDPEANALRVHTITTPDGGRGWQEGLLLPLEGTPAGVAFRTRAPVVANTQEELLAQVRFPGLEAAIHFNGLRSGCAVPLLSRGEPLGTMAFGSRAERLFDRSRVELLVQLAAQLAPAVDNALAWTRLERLKEELATEKLVLEDEIRAERNFDEVVGQSAALRRTLSEVETVAATGSTVLILGETGTGKELVARAVHRLSGRGDRPFVKLNCAAIPTGLLESELFGHEKGAFTGAVAAKAGRFELADGGTLFLDEVGEISSELQPKLLRVLQDQQFERLGGTKTLSVDVRVVAATNRDLAKMVAARQFRSDLYYRLAVFPVHVPPLRERTGDVPLLVRHFVARAARRMGKTIDEIPAAALAALERHAWPGNVRELEHLVERAVILSRRGTLEVPLAELQAAPPPAAPAPVASPPAGLSVLEASERDAIVKALEASGWRVGGERGAAARLGLSRTTLQSKMVRFGIVRPGT